MNPPSASTSGESKVTVAAYVRMSTEHQKYSTSNQMDVIREYAARRGMEIAITYSDEGKSGLRISGRKALREMIADVESGKRGFTAILVYDISRWGRFQDADESAYYEFKCRTRGIDVHYCAEQFENDGSMMANMNKMMKRVMAGTYSQELSVKVFQGACRLIKLGYKQGGAAGYGLRRMLIDQTGQNKTVLKMGEHKSIQTDRVILVPGPDSEVADVRWLYQAFVREGRNEAEIAALLNARGAVTDFGRRWSRGTVHQVLTNEKYIGNNVYHRTSFKLKARHVRNHPDQWIRAEQAWPGIVEPEIFHAAQGIILERSRRLSNQDMLDQLKELFGRYGRLSGILIDEEDAMPSSSAFRYRFGSLVTAYSLIGYSPPVDYAFIEENKSIRRIRPELVGNVIEGLRKMGATVEVDGETDLLVVNDELQVSLVLCRHFTTERGSSRWVIRLDAGLRPDLTVAVRMSPGNNAIRDYYFLPSMDLTLDGLRRRLSEDNKIELEVYRSEDLLPFLQMAERAKIEYRP